MGNATANGLPKPVVWREPAIVRRMIYPPRRIERWGWRIAGAAMFILVVILVIFIHNKDPNAKWLILGMGLANGLAFAFVFPAIVGRSGSFCSIRDTGIHRSEYVRFDYPWDYINGLHLTEDKFGKRKYWVLCFYDQQWQPVFVGLSKRVSHEGIRQWADARGLPLEIGPPFPCPMMQPVTDGPAFAKWAAIQREFDRFSSSELRELAAYIHRHANGQRGGL